MRKLLDDFQPKLYMDIQIPDDVKSRTHQIDLKPSNHSQKNCSMQTFDSDVSKALRMSAENANDHSDIYIYKRSSSGQNRR